MDLKEDHKFKEFYKNYYNSIYKIVYNLSKDDVFSEDLTQETFVNIYKSFHQFSEEKGSFYTWASTIARNTYFQYQRKQKIDKVSSSLEGQNLDSFTGIEPTKNEFIEEIEKKIVKNELKNAISCLPEPEKSIIILKELGGKTLEETGKELNISSRTVSRKLISALDLLKIELEKRKLEI